ncbi:flagellar P-ring protein precursor [Tepidicaulis marinus]|uniref:Flagellar P-ring protein n=1 Tax=Tepidicaulis marinus TaxID=1333998 RepID=A0A081BB30_9HYPH|nr:flagellar basal body P-ring protein FlgI [Tepidicaulis marinus]GAK45248.1 flagellar P-ring protein precursor [Tepidicaulis marinus]
MKKKSLPVRLALLAFLGAALTGAAMGEAAASRIKDIVRVEGVRKNMLVGYGLVVGLNGSGDRLRNIPFTEQSLTSMLKRMGVNVRDEELKTKNVAAVMVTAELPPFSRQGALIDVSVSTLGDATSLAGGALLVTPLMGVDGNVYAVAQGPVAISGYSADGDAQSVTKGIPTRARITNGAIVERELPEQLDQLEIVRLNLRNPDFTTAIRIADTVNRRFGAPLADPLDLNNVEIRVPAKYRGQVARFIHDIEGLDVRPDAVAKVVIDEKSGTIVIGADVHISKVAITHGNLTVRVTETPQVSQPSPFAEVGETAVVPRTDIEIEEGKKGFEVVGGTTTLESLVSGLNRLGMSPGDVISILQAIKASGALQAEIEVI